MNDQERKWFEEIVVKELDACGYFLNPENRNTSMPELIMKFASLYCMEYYYKNYKYEEEIQKP